MFIGQQQVLFLASRNNQGSLVFYLPTYVVLLAKELYLESKLLYRGTTYRTVKAYFLRHTGTIERDMCLWSSNNLEKNSGLFNPRSQEVPSTRRV